MFRRDSGSRSKRMTACGTSFRSAARVLIPETYRYGGEPLGFRNYFHRRVRLWIRIVARMSARHSIIHLSGFGVFLFSTRAEVGYRGQEAIIFTTRGSDTGASGKRCGRISRRPCFRIRRTLTVNGIIRSPGEQPEWSNSDDVSFWGNRIGIRSCGFSPAFRLRAVRTA